MLLRPIKLPWSPWLQYRFRHAQQSTPPSYPCIRGTTPVSSGLVTLTHVKSSTRSDVGHRPTGRRWALSPCPPSPAQPHRPNPPHWPYRPWCSRPHPLPPRLSAVHITILTPPSTLPPWTPCPVPPPLLCPLRLPPPQLPPATPAPTALVAATADRPATSPLPCHRPLHPLCPRLPSPAHSSEGFFMPSAPYPPPSRGGVTQPSLTRCYRRRLCALHHLPLPRPAPLRVGLLWLSSHKFSMCGAVLRLHLPQLPAPRPHPRPPPRNGASQPLHPNSASSPTTYVAYFPRHGQMPY